jgi:hypothetical protein
MLVAAMLVIAAIAAPAESEDRPRVDLEGAWYVLVHYRDATADDPEAVAWQDALWTFERRGQRLHWTLYPTPLFEDTSGRGERDASGRRVSTSGAWEPSPAQRAEIARGLEVASRGVLRASMNGSDASGWSSDRRDPLASASVVSFSRIFSIEGLSTRPVFIRSEVLDGARADELEGETRFETLEVGSAGSLTGRYTRDAERVGRFRMWRAGRLETRGP